VLQRGLIGATLVAATVSLTACGDKPIEDDFVRPAVTAIEQAKSNTCAVNENALRTAIESYSLLEGGPPTDEAALVDAGYLREETDDWDVVDGELVPGEGSGC
jgi:hypothetical protein